MGQGFGIEQEYRVNVGRIIQLPPAMLAQRDDGKTLIRRTRHTFLYRSGDGLIQRMVGKVGKDVRDARQVPDIRQVRNGGHQSDPLALFTQCGADRICTAGKGADKRIVEIACVDQRHKVIVAVNQSGEKRAMRLRAGDGFCDVAHNLTSTTHSSSFPPTRE